MMSENLSAQTNDSKNKVVVIPLGAESQQHQVRETIFTPPVAFSARQSSLNIVKGLGNGGAYINGGSGNFPALVAPIAIPNGASIESIEFFYTDRSNESLRLVFGQEFATGGFDFIEEHSTAGNSNSVRSVELIDTPIEIDTSTGSYLFFAIGGNWITEGENLRVNGVRVTYLLPQ